MAILLKVKWVEKTDEVELHRRIRHIGGDSKHVQWKHTQEQAIEAIESGDWQGLPHRVYVRGYVRQYAGLLKIAGVIEGKLVSWGDESPVYDLPSAHLPAAADGGAGTMQKGKVPFWRSIAAGTSKFYALCRHCFF